MVNQLSRIQSKKMQIFKGYLDELLPQFKILNSSNSFCIYGEIPDIDKETLKEIYKQKIVFMQNISTNNVTNEIRFNFISSSIKDIYEGLSIIADIVSKHQEGK